VQSDVFDRFLRFLAALLDAADVLTARAFWTEVAACVRRYQAAHPSMAETFERLDLFTDEVPLMCMNRLQLRNNQEMVDLADPASAVEVVGRTGNPLVRVG
jgi:siderophore synthetase component